MYRVLPLCRAVITLIWLFAAAVLWYLVGKRAAFIFAFGGGLWLQLYLNGVKIDIKDGVMIKSSGNIFRRRVLYFIKNATGVQTVVVHPVLPAVIKLIFLNGNTYIVGLNGRQVIMIENYLYSVFRQ